MTTAKKAADAGDRVSADAGEPPVVTVAKGLEGPGSMVTSHAPPLGAPIEKPQPWTTKTPLPGQAGRAEPPGEGSRQAEPDKSQA